MSERTTEERTRKHERAMAEMARGDYVQPTFERVEALEVGDAARNIDILVDALEKIEARGCMFAAKGSGLFTCADQDERGLCSACIAHEALETFRGR